MAKDNNILDSRGRETEHGQIAMTQAVFMWSISLSCLLFLPDVK